MEITNELLRESFSYEYSGEALTCRMDDQENLNEILEFYKEIGETVCYDENFLDTEVESAEAECVIMCSCGAFDGGVGTLQEYAAKRQEFLRKMKDCREYGRFMRTCFPNSVFSDGCEQELTHIKNFEVHKDEITDCLSLLDEKAVSLYNEHQTNLVEAQNILQSMMQRTCAPDANHRSELRFEFSFEQENDGKMQEKKKWVECQPHFKLIRDDSDLRVYFQWKDDEVGNGEKVLIGRVGRHPWRKH